MTNLLIRMKLINVCLLLITISNSHNNLRMPVFATFLKFERYEQ